MQTLKSLDLTNLAISFGTKKEELYIYVSEAAGAGKDNEFYILAKNLSLDAQKVCSIVARWLSENKPDEFLQLNETIKSLLP